MRDHSMSGAPEDHAADPRLAELFVQALGLPTSERQAFLRDACRDTPGLAEAVAALLAGHDEAPPFLERGFVEDLSPAQRQIGPYRVLEEIGAGASGIVYRAEQRQPRREVALKVLVGGALQPEMRHRFRREAELAGRLQHPGIAQVYDAGVHDGPLGELPWFAMELVRGRRLDEAARGLPARDICELMARVADAVQHAHEHGVVHRDLKPSNVMVVDASGTRMPKVLDFGIARNLAASSDTLHTLTGTVVGTLPYMSPEQVLGAATHAATDVYALGVILFQLLTGRLPIATEDVPWHEATRRIVDDDPPPLRQLRPDLDSDLATIVAIAQAKDAGHRYPSAAAFANDLRRCLRHEPIAARPPSARYRLQKFVRRHRPLVTAAATVFTVLLGATVTVGWFAMQNAALAANEHSARGAAESGQASAERRNYSLEMLLALRASESPTGMRRLQDILERWQPRAGRPDLRGFEWDLLSAIEHERRLVLPMPNQVYTVRHHPRDPMAVVGGKGFAVVVGIPDGRELARLDTGGHVYSARWSPDGRRLAAAHGHALTVLDVANGFTARTAFAADANLQSLAWDHDNTHVSVFGYRQEAWYVDVDTGTAQRLAAVSAPREVEASPRTSTVTLDRGLYRSHDLHLLSPWPNHARGLSARWHPTGTSLVVEIAGLPTRIAADGRWLVQHQEPRNMQAFAWSPDGNRLASIDGDGTAFVHDVATWTRQRLSPARNVQHGADGLAIDWSADGRWVLCAQRVAELTLLDMHEPTSRRELHPPMGRLQTHIHLSWPRDSRTLHVGLRRATRLLDADDGTVRDDRHETWMRVASPDGRGSAWYRNDCIEWLDADGHVTRHELPGVAGADYTPRLAWSPDGERLFVGSHVDLQVIPRSGPRRTLSTGDVRAMAPGADSRSVVFARGRELQRLDAENGTALGTTTCPDEVTALACHPAGRLLAVALADHRVLLLDLGSLQLVHELSGLEAPSYAIVWQPDGARLAAAARGGVCLWEPRHGELTGRLPEPADAAALAFSADGDELAVGDIQGRIVVFDARRSVRRSRSGRATATETDPR